MRGIRGSATTLDPSLRKEAHPEAVQMEGVFYPIQVTPGKIDANACEVYSFGQCHALALALHQETSYPIVACLSEEGNPDHYAVQLPDGRILDIEGAKEAEEVLEYGETLKPYTSKELERDVEKYQLNSPNLEVARSFVEPLLESTKS
jgi:hypothetical protein